jgi:tetratricopeptide (TPR) repeat protein
MQPDPAAVAEPATVPELIAAARGARRDGDLPRAERLLRAATARAPRNPHARAELAGVLRLAGALADAASEAAAALALDPRHGPALLEAGRIAQARGEPAAALPHFRKAAEAMPGRVAPLLDLAAAARAAGDLDAWRDAAREATRHAPETLRAWLLLGHAERQRGDATAARDAFRQAAALAPEDAAPLLALASLAIAGRDAAGAAAAIAAASALAPQGAAMTPAPHGAAITPAPHGAALALARGQLAMLLARPQDALGCFEDAAARDPSLLPARLGLVQAATAAGRLDIADAAIEELAARPDARDLTLARAGLLRRRGRAAEALALLRAVPSPGPPALAERLRLELALGGPAAAQSLLEARPAASGAMLDRIRGSIAEADLRLEEAAEAYGAALRHDPADTAALDARARVAVLLLDEAAAANALHRQAEAETGLRRAHGRPHAPSQTLTGQIALEFRLDREATRRLGELLLLPPAARIAPLGALLAEAPDSTAAALWLLVSLRQARLFDAPPPGACPIPPRLLWVGTPAEDRLGAAWAALPGIAATFLPAGRDARAFLAERFGPVAEAAWRRAGDDTVRSDLLRICWLASEGGWSPAPDTLPVAPPWTLPGGGAGMVAAQGAWGAPTMTLLGAAPGHPVMRHAAATLIEALARGDAEHRWLRSGPGFLARVLATTLARHGADAAAMLLPEHVMAGVVAGGCAA